MVWEIVDNSIDEALAGFATHIEVFIEKMIRLQLLMMGVVFLLIFKKKQVVPPLKQSLRFCTLEVNSAVAATRFQVVLHGVGSSVVNALSTQLDVSVHRNGKIHYQEYRRGHVVSDLAVIGDTDRHGTTVHFYSRPRNFH